MIKFDNRISNIVVIGCGGVASWLVRPLVMFLRQCDHKPVLTLIDGDTIEERNLDRQWFDEEDIGQNKAEAMAELLPNDYPIDSAVREYYMDGHILPIDGTKLFLCCADNHAARRAVLNSVDRGQGFAIIGGNEYVEAEAYYYERGYKDGPCDPRTYYPSILTDDTGDPTRPAGCTGPAAVAAPQLVFANFSAANHMLWLIYHHFVERRELGSSFLPEYAVVRCWNNVAMFRTTRACDLAPVLREEAQQ